MWMCAAPAGRDAGCIRSMSFCAAKTHKPKNGMDAIALGRQEAGCFRFLGFLRSKNS
jgi:hypothetical protein